MFTYSHRLRLAAQYCLVLIAVCGVAFGLDLNALQPQGYVSDFAGVLPADQKAAIERYCGAVERTAGVQIAIVTLPSLDGEPVEDVANSLFRKWGIGSKQENEGLLLLLSIQDRRSRLEVGYGVEPSITDGLAGETLRNMRPALRAGAYADAVSTAVRFLGGRIAQAKNVQIDELPPQTSRQRPEETHIPPWLWIVGALFLLSMAGRGNFLGAWMLGSMLMNSGRGRSSGGFGGYDSGDSFHGFGGGDAGGGGASSDW